MVEIFSKRLKLLRKKERMSQIELAEELDMSRSTVGYYETNKRNPDLKKIKNIADYFEVSVDYLLGRSNEKITVDQYKNEIDISDDIKQKIINSNIFSEKL